VASEYMILSEEEIDEMFDYSKYIASDIEIREWNRLSNLHDKQVFIYHFWKTRDLTPEDSRNEFKFEYLRRVNIANERFKSFNRKGWATDQGRIYCLFGEPSNIDRYPAETGLKPYEIWTYERIEGGVIFVFADLFGFSEMSLIHSTKQGELRDDDWHRKVDAFR
jgi:GWxTD domain-containing protein